MEAFTATIIQCMPEHGQALVRPIGGQAGGATVMVATLPYISGYYGACVYSAIPEGTNVECIATGDGDLLSCNIVGVCNYQQDKQSKKDTRTVLEKLAHVMSTLVCKFFARTERISPHAAGAPHDLLSGDMVVRDKQTGVSIEARRQIASLSGPALSGVHVDAENTVRLRGYKYIQETPLSEHVDEGDLVVDNLAKDLAEAVGAGKNHGALFKEEALDENEKLSGMYGGDTKLVPVVKNGIPLYRLQHLSGGLVDGDEQTVLSPPENGEHTSTNTPEVLARRRVSFDGAMTTASSDRLSSIKAPKIPAISQLGYGASCKSKVDGQNGVFDDLREPFDTSDEDGKSPLHEAFNALSEEEQIRDSALYSFGARVLTQDYAGKKHWAPERGLGLHNADVADSAEVEGVHAPTDAATYTPPKKINLAGKKVYDSTSFITQEPDGSICICDGYGSEIRMSQGNIYISPALDLYLRPGRDISVMAGRHQSYNSQGSLTVNTSDAAFVRAEHRMEVCAGTAENQDREGILIESRSQYGDVVVKSNGGLSLTGATDVLVGRRTADGTAPAQGTLTLDTGANGMAYLNGGHGLSLEAASVDLCGVSPSATSSSGPSGSAIRIAGNTIDMLTSAVNMPAQLIMRAPAGPVRVELPRDGSVADIRLYTIAKDKESLVVGGQAVVNGLMKVNKQTVVCGQLVANGVWNTSQFCTPIAPRSRAKVFESAEMPDVSYLMSRASAAANAIVSRQSSYGLLSADYFERHQFNFPEDYGVDPGMVFPGMVWQEHVAGAAWTEHAVKSADDKETMCYPGANIWNGATVSSLDGPVKLNGGYKINAIGRRV